MCTVTYIHLNNNNFILTSSRDVPFSREKADLPKQYIEQGISLYYPKDGKAGGTWIGFSDKKRMICLLNGGFKNHKQQEYYIKSRGLIVKELLKSDDITKACKTIDLEKVEPFTLVIVAWIKKIDLFEFVWDGNNKHFSILKQENHIWSSSTLYTDAIKNRRKSWFKKWELEHHPQNPKTENVKNDILKFHHTAGEGDSNVDVLMKRVKVGTVSITQVIKNNNDIKMNYEEIKS
ncbi:MAG: NRDE family protein [Flavobacteriaceae bacterium]|nr:NRDE family protein [Flavobacteriaceae bacterium]